MRNNFSAIVFVCLFAGCTNNKLPDDILPPKKMEAVLWDIIQAEAYTNNFIKYDSTKNAEKENVILKKQVFSIHKISKDLFEKSYQYYSDRPALMTTILDSIEAKKNTLQKGILEKKTKPVLKKEISNEKSLR